MKTAHQIKTLIKDTLTGTNLFTDVITPPDDKLKVVMRAPAASIYFKGFTKSSDKRIQVIKTSFAVQLKFIKIGLSEAEEELHQTVQALSELEPEELAQKKITDTDDRSAIYQIDITFTGVRS